MVNLITGGKSVVVIFCFHAVLAQLVEHLTCNHEVFGSIPKDGSRAVVLELKIVDIVDVFIRGVSRAVKWGRL